MSELENANFGDIIREARRRKGWTQTELAEKAGVSRPTVVRIEANNDAMTVTVAKIAQVLTLKLELTDGG